MHYNHYYLLIIPGSPIDPLINSSLQTSAGAGSATAERTVFSHRGAGSAAVAPLLAPWESAASALVAPRRLAPMAK